MSGTGLCRIFLMIVGKNDVRYLAELDEAISQWKFLTGIPKISMKTGEIPYQLLGIHVEKLHSIRSIAHLILGAYFNYYHQF